MLLVLLASEVPTDPPSGKMLYLMELTASLCWPKIKVSTLLTLPQPSSSVIGYDSVSQTAQLIISPTIAKAVAPPHGDTITFREKYSSCRVTGHDFLDIGTGGFGDTNYPGAPAQTPNQDLEVKEFSIVLFRI